MPIGVHTSIAGGLYRAVERAASLGCDCMQIFGRNPRSWVYKPLAPDDAPSFRAAREAAGLWPVAVHTNYLINLSSPDANIFEKSVDIFKKELSIAEAIGADYLVTHLGSPKDSFTEAAIGRVGEALREVRKSGLGAKTMILLENTSGAGTGFGSDLKDLGEIIARAGKDGLATGLCLDTCHAFAAGYPFSTPQEARALVSRIDAEAGIENLRLLHLNDSKGALGGRLDRHEHIGKGMIGLEAFGLFLNRPEIKKLPMVLETPKRAEGDDLENIAAVRRLLAGRAAKGQ